MANIPSTNSPFYNVIALDMDGTLLNPEYRITDFTKKTIQDIVAKYPTQVFVVLASGRHDTDLRLILDGLELPEQNGAIVGCNGACVYAFNTNNTSDEKAEMVKEEKGLSGRNFKHDLIQIRNVCMPPESVYRILSIWLESDENKVNFHFYHNDRWLCAMEEKEILKAGNWSGFGYELCNISELIQAYKEHEKRGQEACGDDSTDGYSSSNPLDGVRKIFLSSKNHELLASFRSRVQAEVPLASLAFSSKCFLEIMAPDVSKLIGLESLMPYIQAYAASKRSVGDGKGKGDGKTEDENEEPWTVETKCLAFGDNENDVSMVTKAARGCLMGNAPDTIKESLKNDVVIVGTNYEDGVAHELKRIYNV